MPLNVPYYPVLNIQYAVPTAGQTVAIASTSDVLIIEPAGLLATLTVNLPAGVPDGKAIGITCTQVVTTLTFGGGTIINGITAFAAGIGVQYIYRGANSQWYRIQ